MPESISVVALEIEEDVLIPLPEEFGVNPGDEFEVTARDGVIELNCIAKAVTECP